MVYSNFKNKLLLCLCVFIIIFPFLLVSNVVNADYEELTTTRDVGYGISSATNYFVESTSRTTRYFHLEDNYRYKIVNNSTSERFIAVSNNQPGVNVPYTFLGTLAGGETYEYIKNGEEYFYFSSSPDSGIKVYREKIPGMNVAITDLVDNVGVSSIWNIFDISINYIVVVVLVAFGFFIIFKLIKKISKGKEGL